MTTAAEQTTGQVDERFANKYQTVSTETGTSIDLAEADAGALLYCTASGAVTITIPESTAAAGKVFPIGTYFDVYAAGAGGVTVAKTGSDTLSGDVVMAQKESRRVVKVAATTWVALGVGVLTP